jgi:hypothetical protein
MKVWLLEDDEDCRDTLWDEIRGLRPSASVEGFSSVADALQATSRPDLIIADATALTLDVRSRLRSPLAVIAQHHPAARIVIYSSVFGRLNRQEVIAQIKRETGVKHFTVADILGCSTNMELAQVLKTAEAASQEDVTE